MNIPVKAFLLVGLALLGYNSFSQSQSDSESAERSIKLPLIELNMGYGFLFSDNGITIGTGGSNAQLHYQLSINQPVLPYLSTAINLSTSTFADDRMLDDVTNINFRSVVFSQDLSIYYELSHLFKQKSGSDKIHPFDKIQPYVGLGIGMVSFRAKGDLKDKNGVFYHFWSDGSIRDVAESDPNAEASNLLMRDRTYESDLRDANVDGFGRYDQLALRVPFEVGFRYQFTKNIGVNLKVRYHLNFTDLIDNVSELSIGQRSGSSENDGHLTASVGITAFLGRYNKKPPVPPKNEPILASTQGIDSTTESQSESDTDLLTDSLSASTLAEQDLTSIPESQSENEPIEGPDTEMFNENGSGLESDSETSSLEPQDNSANAESAEKGLEEATDNGIDLEKANEGSDTSMDDELITAEDSASDGQSSDPSTSSNASTTKTDANLQGSETENEDSVDQKKASDSDQNSDRSDMDIMEAMEGLEGTQPKEVGSYHWADVNKDRYISSEEVLHFIDLLFDGDSEYTVPMIHGLIEYYFDQD